MVGPSPTIEASTREPLALSLAVLPAEFVPSSSLRSLGSEIAWTQGPSSTADIWRLVPGQSPERIFENPRRDSYVTDVARNQAGYAFVEANEAAFGAGGWRLWYLPNGESVPLEVARGNAPGGVPPSIALDDQRLVWAGYDEPPEGPFSFLRVVSLPDIGDVETLVRLPIEEALLRTPVLDGDALWYAAIDPDFQYTGVGDESHLEWIDLASSSRTRERFPGTADDADPAVTAAAIAWKTVRPGISYLSWGEIHVLDRATKREDLVPIERANRPSVGDRFVSFEEFTSSRLLLWDLADQALIDATASLPAGATLITSESVSGSLFACAFAADPDAPQRIAWGVLPR